MHAERQEHDISPEYVVAFHNFGRAKNGQTGYDVRFQVTANTDLEAFNLSGKLPSPHVSDEMFTKFETGAEKSFDNIPYKVNIVGSDFFYCQRDAVGNETWGAKVYIDGHHQGFGYKNSKGWREAEQVAFASVTITPWKPGKVMARLVPPGEEHRQLEKLYKTAKADPRMNRQIQEVRLQVLKAREEQKRQTQPVQVVLFDTKSVQQSKSPAVAAD